MWAFVLFEGLVFTSYFAVYVVRRTLSHDLFLQSQAHLDLRVGVFNTLVLLVSSWSVARSVQAAREGAYRRALAHLWTTMLFGLVFLVSKVHEWAGAIAEGFGFTADEFFSFYYFLTGIHFLHLLIGFVFLGVAARELASPARRSQELVETCATYWHTIDFLWVLIFALLYVMR
ncbi:MAG TPA: cytochrome c oxidase subunit 3 [Candidatus Limnocylindria bacterium]|nr:cytochrome c oxidase subunit 3 [Candidatus Limnocylindria bacterium]